MGKLKSATHTKLVKMKSVSLSVNFSQKDFTYFNDHITKENRKHVNEAGDGEGCGTNSIFLFSGFIYIKESDFMSM